MYTGRETADNYKIAAINKTTNKWYMTLILAIFAGCFIAIAGLLATIVGTAYDGVKSIIAKAAVFPAGLILVVLTGSELFTGNCLLLAPLMSKDIKISGFFKNLGIVYLGNFAGSVLIAVIAIYSGILPSASAAAAVTTALNKCTANFGETLLRSIPCNFLVCFAVWCAMASKSAAGKILAVYPPIFAFVACGFEHSVANMYYLTSGLLASAQYGIASDGLNAGTALLYSLFPSTIGNIIGGTVCAAIPLWLVFFRNKPYSKTDNR